jgi:hypothetical protein
MSVLAPVTSTKPSAVSSRAIPEHRAYYAERLQMARANIERLETRLKSNNRWFNPDLAEIWQNEIVYWRQAERNATAILAQLGGSVKDAKPH